MSKGPDVFLIRFGGGDYGTKSIWKCKGFDCRAMELPWKENASSVSCIPDGSYPVSIRTSRKYGRIYHIKEVPDRTWILSHAGNWAGDVSKNLRSHSKGCVLLGKYHATIMGQMGVALSKTTLRRFMNFMDGRDFTLHVITIKV